MASRKSREEIRDEEEEEEEEDDIAVEKLETWYIFVHVHDKVIPVSCGDASQRVKWAAHVGIARWDEQYMQGWKRLGIPVAVRLHRKDGVELEMNKAIRDVAKNGDHIFVETSLSPMDHH